ncbi:MAG: 3-hydroxyacyl-ACP dehydratase FabZ family protein [Parcubacteria group bacterium]|jgi:3-hydroxymyristoyl/3-hydroxydecanoyl-(acyl carrier protein) dehydratase
MADEKKSFFLERGDIAEMIPHTGPAQMLDRISYNTERPHEMVGIKTICSDDPWFMGHFRDNPIFPGHCQIECANLVAAVLAKNFFELSGTPMVVGVDGVRYKKQVKPHDLLAITVKLLGAKRGMYFFSAIIQNRSGETVAEIKKIIGTVQ